MREYAQKDTPPYNTTGKQQRENIFDKEDKRFYLESLQRYKDKYKMKIRAYCLMGNHTHIRAIPEKETSFARGIGETNLLYTQYINRKYNRSGKLWQNRFFSAIVEEEPYLWAVIRYREQNPVRAKLVKQAEDYQWSSARAHILVLGIRDDILSTERMIYFQQRAGLWNSGGIPGTPYLSLVEFPTRFVMALYLLHRKGRREDKLSRNLSELGDLCGEPLFSCHFAQDFRV